MAANDTLGLNQVFQIYHEDGSAYEGLVMHKSATDSVVMSLGDSITGDVYWRDNELALTMKEYITYNGVNYVLVNPPTIVREGMVADNSELKGMTKYSFKFYHPMYQLGNFPFSDVAVTNDQKKFLSENKTFSWIGTANDYLAKLNKNLDGTQWIVEMSSNFPNDKKTEMSDVLAFDKNTVADALKVAYDTWGVPYVIDVVTSSEASYNSGKRFKVVWGLPSNEIYENATKKQQGIPYIFKMGRGVGLKNNSRTPRNNKIITRIAGYGSETNIPYGYPQIVWTGNQSWDYTINNSSSAANSYPIYDGIVGGQKVRLIKHPFTRTHLMPNVYVDAVNKKVNPNASGYSANTVLVDYYDATAGEDYPNPINLNAPSYDIHEFDDIKPELGSESIVSVTPLNSDLTPASSWDDTMDDDGNFIQSYFQITLPTLSFDIYACAAITEAMEINMRSGACLGCTFPVEVDWEDYKANFYNEDGEFDPVIHSVEGDGHVRNGKKYPDSSNSSTPVTLILKKENTTFGVLMPNTYQHPATGDQFVVLGISLPTSYITSAQTRLDNAMKSFMLENNVHYYDYPLKFDEAFLRNNTYILEQLKPNAIVRFEFAGDTLPLYVKQMNVKFGEGVLPKYDITLTDNVEVVLNQIGQVADDVERLASLISILRQSYGSNVWVELAKKLSKTDDDTAQGFIRFVKGLQVGERFDSGLLGEGGVFRKDADGTTYIEADKLYIRMKAYFDTVEIRKYMHSGGNRIASPAGAKCVRVDNMAWYAAENKFVPVDEYGTYRKKDINDEEQVIATGLTIVKYRCYFRGEDNDGDKVTNDFVVGDQAYCHITNGGNASLQMHHYWRLIVGTNVANDSGRLTEDGEFWIDLANYFDAYGQPANLQWTNSHGVVVNHKSHQAGSDIPRAQDDIVQLGNADDVTRQGAIIEYSSGEDSPSYKIYQNIDDFSFEDTNFIAIGYNTQTGRAYMNVYGDAYIGDPDESTYIRYSQGDGTQQNPPRLEIKAVIEGSSPISGTNTTIDGALTELWDGIGNLQNQIDGSIETWFENYMPVAKTQEGAPANRVPLVTITIDGQTVPCQPYYNWYMADHGGQATEVNTERLKHLGDVFYDNESGYAFRFSQNDSTHAFEWVEITDAAVVKALRDAAEAYGLADSKNKIFTTVAGQLPPYPWKEGDLWVNATYPADGSTYSNDILKCTHSRTSGGSISDWMLASKYTDDTKVERYTNILTGVTEPSESSQKEIALAAENAIRTALGGNFIIEGGLMLMSIIGMRRLNDGGDPSDPDDYTTWAGISGVYDDNLYGGGLAAWFGGSMVDKRNPTTGEYDVVNGAKTGFRFDGSGWLADGNINWNSAGSMVIKNLTTIYGTNDSTGISINELSALTSIFHTETYAASGGSLTELLIKPQNAFSQLFINRSGNPLPASSYPQDHTINDYSVLNYGEMKERFVPLAFFNALFTAYSDSAHTNSVNPTTWTAQTLIDNLKIMVGVWTNQYVSAFGQNSSSGGGGSSTLAGLNDVSLSSPQAGQSLVYRNSHWVNEFITQGTVTSVGISVPEGFSVSPSSINTTGTFVISFGGSVAKNKVLASPSTAAGAPSWRVLVAADIPDLSSTYAVASDVTTLQGYFTNGAANKLKLTTPITLWGESFDGSSNISGDMSSVGDISFGASGKNIGGLLYFNTTNSQVKVGSSATLVQYTRGNGTFTPKLYVDGYAGINGEIYADGLDLVGSNASGNVHGGYIDFHYNKSTSDYTARIIESESGLLNLVTNIKTSRIYLYKPNSGNDTGAVYIECDSNHDVKLVGNFYATGAVSAFGSNTQSSGGGGDVYWSQLSSTSYDANQQIASAHLISVTNPLYILLNDDSNPSVTYDGKASRTVGNLVTKAWANSHYYAKIDGAESGDVLLANGSKIKLKTVNGYSLFITDPNDTNIDASGGGGSGSYLPIGGGTMTGSISSAANVYPSIQAYNSAGSAYAMKLGYYPTGGYSYFSNETNKYEIRLYDNGDFKYAQWSSGTVYTVWHSGNFTPSNYLPLTGGTLSRATTQILDSILKVYNTATHNSPRGIEIFTPNNSGFSTPLLMGKEYGTNNMCDIDFIYQGNNSTDNAMSFGFYANDNLLYIKANGKIGIGTQQPLQKLSIKSSSGDILSLDNISTSNQYTCINYMIEGVYKWSAGCGTNNFYFYSNVTNSSVAQISPYGQIITNIATGTSPLSVVSTTVCTNLNADMLDGQHGSYYATASSLGSYLALVGGTMSGTIKSANNVHPSIQALGGTNGTTPKMNLGYYPTGGYSYFSNETNKWEIRIYDNGSLYLSCFATGGNSYKIWNEGNDGTGSGLDADLLDGQHASYFATASSLSNYVTLATAQTITGTKTFSLTTTSASDSILYLTNNYSGAYARGIDIQMPNAPTGNFISPFLFGVSHGSNNQGTISFGYVGNGSTSNYIGIGFYANDNILNVVASGNVGIGTNTPSYKLHVKGRICAEYDTQGAFEAIRGNYASIFGINSGGYAIIATGQVGNTSSTVRLSFSPYDASESYALFPSTSVRVGVSGGSTFYDGKYVQIGAVRLVYDSTNNAIKVEKYDGTAANFYATGSVAAFGANTGSGGGVGDVTWSALATAVSSTTQQIDASHITDALSTCVRTTGNQTITGNKTLYNAIVTSNFGAKFESICIACDTSGFVSTHSGEINRFSGDLHLQHDSSYGVTMFNKLRFSKSSGNIYLTSNGAYFTLSVGSASHAVIDYDWVVTSDMRRKDVIMNAGASIEQIADAPIFYYRLKGSPETTLALGSSAQYWQQVFPNAISENPDGFLSMNYSAIALASAVVTARKVKNHEDRITELENENKLLKEEIRLLKAA